VEVVSQYNRGKIMGFLTGHTLAWCLFAHLLSPSVPYHNTITHIACNQGVDPRLVASFIEQESSFNTKSVHHDPSGGYSYGLMQLKLDTAKFMGFKGSYKRLYDPYVNINYGVKYIVYLNTRYKYIGSIISAYNAGSATWVKGRGFRNQKYVNSVYRRYLKYKK
jgi:soluble lytic murein transglycosylase-like protein